MPPLCAFTLQFQHGGAAPLMCRCSKDVKGGKLVGCMAVAQWTQVWNRGLVQKKPHWKLLVKCQDT